MPFIKVNCAALPETLVESELFGYERGAFTGAVQRKKGRFELANGGTLFLDEVGELSPGTQVKLLRVLQEREFERVGGTESVPVDVRVIAATNCDLEQALMHASFREDLYYRLNVFPIVIPPLRARKADVAPLVDHFIVKHAQAQGKGIQGIYTRAIDLLFSYHWPGNVRELENRMKRAVIMADGKMIGPEDLDLESRDEEVLPVNLKAAREQADRRAIRQALARSENNISNTAKLLGISRPTLYDLLKQYGLQP
jgi:two-component system NtrC family response regulator